MMIGTMWERGPIPPELAAFPGYLLARLGEASSRRFRGALDPAGLHPRQFGVMTIVDAHPGLSQYQLHELTGIDTSSMVALIDELEERGLAERRSRPDDRRVRSIFLTDAGEEALARMRRVAAEHLRQFFAPLDPDELATLHELLRKLAASLPAPEPDGAIEDEPLKAG
jgi:DNA-binding MarR family transcriptional regulator